MAQDIKIATIDIVIALFRNHELSIVKEMDQRELEEIIQDIEEELYENVMAEMQNEEIYGDPNHEEYLMSDAYREDCKQEQWDWLKNEDGA